jgi:hypothetical protein
MPRPLLVLSGVEGAGAATADNGNALEEVPADGAGLTTAPNDSDVAGAVVTDVVFAGATVLVVVGLSTLESLLCVWGVVLCIVVVGALTVVGAVVDGAPFNCTEASGADFLMSLCDFRAGEGSLVAEVFAPVVVVFEESWARSCPKAINCSARADVGSTFSTSVKAAKAASDSTCPANRRDDSKCFMGSSSVTCFGEPWRK